MFPGKRDVLDKCIVGDLRKSTGQMRVPVTGSGVQPELYCVDLPGQAIWESQPKLISTRNLQGEQPQKKLNVHLVWASSFQKCAKMNFC